MPFVDIINRPKDPHNLSGEEKSWIVEDPANPGLHFIKNESTDRLDRAILAAQTSKRAGGAVLLEARSYELPPLVDGLEVVQMGQEAWQKMLAAATWTALYNQDAAINLDHPDVKAVL